MASFTDSPQAFLAPYTPKVDLNLYGQTLDYKQNQYNQGVQRIQNSVDQLAGLDIMHPLAKEYLQQKLTDLGTKFNTMAGGDFSNQSLVSKALALAPQVARDEKVQNAVISTQQIRSLSASQKKLYEKDPSLYPSSMRDMDNKAVSDYLNSTNLDDTYHGTTEASRYTDYHKDIEAKVKEIVPDVKLEVNADGRYQWKSEKYSTVTNDRIQGVITAYLATNPEATRSMNADAAYTYKNASASFMKNHLNETYDRNIASLESINQKYQMEISSHPADRDFVRDRSAAMAANEHTIQEMKSKKSIYGQYLDSGTNLDQVKQSVFADNLKGMFSSIFQKDDIDRKIEENYNAVNADKVSLERANLSVSQARLANELYTSKRNAISEGFEPYADQYGNPIPITPNSKYWAVYQDTIKGKGGKGKKGDGTDDNDTDFSGKGETGGIDATSKYGSIGLINDQIGLLTKAVENGKDGIKDKFYQGWRSTYGTSYKTDAEARAAFKDYDKKQYDLFLAGDSTTDPHYKEYRQKTAMMQLQIDAYGKLYDDALTDAATKNSAKDATVTINGLNLNRGGKVYKDFTVNIDRDSKFIDEFNKLQSAWQEDAYQNHSLLAGKEYVGWKDLSHKQRLDVIDKQFRNSPYYADLRAITDAGAITLGNFSSNLASAIGSLKDKRLAATNQYLKDHESQFAPVQYEFSGKKEVLDSYKRKVEGLLTANQGVTDMGNKIDMSKHKTEDIEIENAAMMPTGYIRYAFKTPDGKVDYITSKTPGADGILPVDPDAEMKRVIAITGMTPTQGDGVLTSKDGKIRYSIRKAMYGDGYDAFIIQQGKPVPVPTVTGEGDLFHNVSPSQIQKSMDILARSPSRTDPNQPISREEAYDAALLTSADYNKKYPKPATKS